MRKILLLSLGLFSTLLIAQQSFDLDYYLPQHINYNDDIPKPSQIIGHEVGEWHVTHDKLMFYMQTLAETSDRITLETSGHTFEGRP
ncbi:MAG: zinc carboxypeptidase, partial [Eudoraea sp.]|nr:zinc carboxypeptidase [Eudoraea sp.]